MTTEQAIKLLHRLQDEQFDGPHGDERREALKMAVRALEPNLGQKTIDCIIKRLNDEDRTTGDTIYRQDAIAIVRHRCKRLTTACVLAVTEIEQLPPAQPEIIYCKDCRKHNKKIGFDENFHTVWKEDACPLASWRGKAQGHEFDYQFCAYAERRQDV